MAVLVKRSSVAGKVPLTTDLNYGEIAVNSNDGRMFMKANNGGGDTIVEITSVTSLLNKAITTNVTLTATEYSNAMLVFSGALTGNTVVTVPNTAHSFIAVNKTTGNYSLTLKSSGQTPSVAIVQGAAESLLCDTTGVYATASTTGVEFSKIVPVAGNITTDITHAGAILIVTASGVTITLGGANSYPAGAGFGILNLSAGNITVAGNGTDTSELGLPLTVKPKDSYYLASNNVSAWNCIWYSNPFSPTFLSANITNNLTVGGTFTSTGAANLNGGATVVGTSSLNGPVVLTNAGPSVTFNASGPSLSSPASNTLAASNGSSEVFRINSSGHLLVGTTTDDGSTLATSGDIGAQQGKITSTRFASNGGALVLRNAAGSFASATATPITTQSGTITFRSYDGTNYQDNASIDAWTEVATTNTSSAANLRFFTTPSGAITKSERMRITARGSVLIGQTSDDGTSALQVTGAGKFTTTLAATGNITSGALVQGTGLKATTASGDTLVTIDRVVGQQGLVTLSTAGSTRWQFGVSNDAESGSNAGSNFVINGFADAGTILGTSFEINRKTGNILMGLVPAQDDGSSSLQIAGTVRPTGGVKFPDGTVQTTANGVTAPTSTLYTPANGVTNWVIGNYNVGFVQVFKNNQRMVPTVDFQATDGNTLTVTVAATGRDRYEVLTSVIYSPTTVFAPTSYSTSITAGQNLITTNYNVGCVWLFKNNMKLLPADFTATNGSTITLTNNSDSSTDVYEVVTFQPFAVSGMLPLAGGTMTGPLTVNANITSQSTVTNGAAATNRINTYQTAGSTRFVEGVDNTAEGGSNAGSNWFLGRYTDAGALIDNPLYVTRSSGLVTLSQGLVTPDGYTIAASSQGRNKIINGSANIGQRAAFAFTAGVSGYGGPDRFWAAVGPGGGQFTQSVGTLTYGGVTRNAVCQTVNTAYSTFTGTNYWSGVTQLIETCNMYDMQGQPSVLSFIFASNISGTFSVCIQNAAQTSSFVSTFTAVAGTPTKVIIPVASMPTSWNLTSGTAAGLRIWIGFINQASYVTASTNSWIAGNYLTTAACTNWAATIGNYILVSELQYESGTYATPYERLNIQTIYNQCLRYYQIVSGDYETYQTSGQNIIYSQLLPVPMRATPTASTPAGGSLGGGAAAPTLSSDGRRTYWSSSITGATGTCFFVGYTSNLNAEL